jgi:hypothetical protein
MGLETILRSFRTGIVNRSVASLILLSSLTTSYSSCLTAQKQKYVADVVEVDDVNMSEDNIPTDESILDVQNDILADTVDLNDIESDINSDIIEEDSVCQSDGESDLDIYCQQEEVFPIDIGFENEDVYDLDEDAVLEDGYISDDFVSEDNIPTDESILDVQNDTLADTVTPDFSDIISGDVSLYDEGLYDNYDCVSDNPIIEVVEDIIPDNCELKKFYFDGDSDGFGGTKFELVCENPNPALYTLVTGDCDDNDNVIYPGCAEVCDNKDNDCNGKVDDNVKPQICKTECGEGLEDCINGLWINCSAPKPQLEICDGKDNNCDGKTDEGVTITCYKDLDLDGYGNPSQFVDVCSCSSGYVKDNADCDDSNNLIHPKADELCNSKDDNCDGLIDIVNGDFLKKTEKCDIYNNNLNGIINYKCQNGKWVAVDSCSDPDECQNGNSYSQACTSPCGNGTETVLCSNGKWGVVSGSCNAPKPNSEDLGGDGQCDLEDWNGVDENCNKNIDDICYTSLGGEFEIGCDGTNPTEATYCQIDATWGNLNPKHLIFIDDVKIGRFPISVRQYKECVKVGACTPPMKIGVGLDNNYYNNTNNLDAPIVNVKHNQAVDFCKWAGGGKGRLPTEAEIEIARGQGKYMFAWGNDVKTGTDCVYVGNTMSCSLGMPMQVDFACFKNVKENIVCGGSGVSFWASDWYSKTYMQNSPYKNPAGPLSGTDRAVRNANFNSTSLSELTVWFRSKKHPEEYSDNLSFICALPSLK